MGAKLVIITVLAGIGFFNFHNLLSLQIQRAGFMFMILVCLAYALRQKAVTLRQCQFPRLPWLILIAGLFISMFMASFYHPQSLKASIIAQSTNVMAFGSFFVLLLLNPDPKQLIKWLWMFFALSVIVFFANIATIPHNIFGEPMSDDLARGIARVRMPLLQVTVFLFLYSIGRWHTADNKWKWVVLGLACYIMIVLQITRQVIFIASFLGLLFILQNMSWYKKIGIGVLIMVVGYVAFVNLPLFKSLKEVTIEQIEDNEDKEDVRLGAYRYYCYEANDNVETLLFGNGTPSLGKTPWGKRFEAYIDETGHLLADVGWAASVFMYGLIATIALLAIMLSAIFKNKPPEQQYLTYFLIAAVLNNVASGIWFSYIETFFIMIALYLVYRPVTDEGSIAVGMDIAPLSKKRSFQTE